MRHRVVFAGVAFGVACLLALVVVWAGGPVLVWLRGVAELATAMVREAPWPLFYLALALLPLVGVPVVPLYLAAGAAHGLGSAMAGVALALVVNLSLSYGIAWRMRDWVGGLVARAGWRVPGYPKGRPAEFTLLVRLTPGAPLMVQNYVLGLTRVPFPVYLGVSLGAEMLIALGYIVTGQSLYRGQWGFIWIGLGVIVFVLLLTRLLRGVLSNKVTTGIDKIDETEQS